MNMNVSGHLDFSPQLFHGSYISLALTVWSEEENYKKMTVSILKWKKIGYYGLVAFLGTFDCFV